VCDIDPRAVELAKELWGDELAAADVVEPGGSLPYPDEHFDLVVSMDVIEHVLEPVAWTREVLRVLKPGGLCFLTTPNYGSPSLSLIEKTALEAVARVQGFSRRDIHPTKMTASRLSTVLAEAGAAFSHIEMLAFGWVLSAYARKS
jgi:2-polyprenyl-3-methyl-5-hydroxy-6-metoxy-1,4-benzoquinol methylase